MKPIEVFRLRPGHRIRWISNNWAEPINGEISAITPECNFVIHWDDDTCSALTPERLAWSTFEVLNEDRGVTTLQDDIQVLLLKADIPAEWIDSLMEMIADAEEARELTRARQNREDAAMIDRLAEAERHSRSTR